MALLDNSGDIILDAVLTDTGRKRMAKGEFQIVKFALGDDEVNYQLYNKDHPSGSAFYDLEIMQTPLLEAVTNNTSTMHSKLMTIENPNHLYLPVMKVNSQHSADSGAGTNPRRAGGLCEVVRHGITGTYSGPQSEGLFLITCDKETERQFSTTVNDASMLLQAPPGVMFGSPWAYNSANQDKLNFICVDQGIDSQATDLSAPGPYTPIPSKLRETQFMVQIDHRLGRIATAKNAPVGHTEPAASFSPNLSVADYHFVDDDNMATYYFGFPTDSQFLQRIPVNEAELARPGELDAQMFAARNVIGGPLGTRLAFRIHASINLQQSTSLFTKLGGGADLRVHGRDPDNPNTIITAVNTAPVNRATYRYIDSIVRVVGVTTGYHLDIPVRFIKKV